MNLNDLMGKRAALVAEARSLLDAAKSESRELSGEESEKYDRIMADVDAIRAQADREVELREHEKSIAAAVAEAPSKREAPESDLVRLAKGEIRSATVSFTQAAADGLQSRISIGNRWARRDLGRTTATDGKELIATDFAGRLYEHLIENTAIRECGTTVIVTGDGNAIDFPKTTSYSTAALFGEGVTVTESDPQYGTMTLDAFKYGVLFQVSSELLRDERVGAFEAHLAKQAGQAIANAAGAHFVTGDGSSKPNGVVTAATVGKTATGTNSITTDEVIDLFHSVLPPYRRNSAWMMDDATAQHLRKKTINSEVGNYIWQPGLQAGQPDLLLGRPVVIDTNVATLATGSKPLVFGDFSAYYIREVGNVRFERSDDFAFNADLVTFRALWRTDGDLIDTSAVKTLVTS